MTAPCGVPSTVSIFRPSSSTPAANHLRISLTIRRSPIRCSINRISHAWLIVSKEAATDYPSPWYSGFGNDHPRAPRLRRPIAGRDQQHPAARRPPRSRGLARRQPVAHSSRVDRLAPRAGGANTGGRCRRWRPRSGQTRGFASPAQGHRRSERPTHRVGAAKGERSCN